MNTTLQPLDNCVPQAVRVLTIALRQDQSFAWSYQCNIAMAFVDEGGDQLMANKAAARFMRNWADVDMEKNVDYARLMGQLEANRSKVELAQAPVIEPAEVNGQLRDVESEEQARDLEKFALCVSIGHMGDLIEMLRTELAQQEKAASAQFERMSVELNRARTTLETAGFKDGEGILWTPPAAHAIVRLPVVETPPANDHTEYYINKAGSVLG